MTMPYGQTQGIFKATRSERYMTQAQRSRQRGPILPKEQPRRGFLAWVLGR